MGMGTRMGGQNYTKISFVKQIAQRAEERERDRDRHGHANRAAYAFRIASLLLSGTQLTLTDAILVNVHSAFIVSPLYPVDDDVHREGILA